MMDNGGPRGLHIVFTGFPYPHGMAGTKRCQHAIDVLQEYPDVLIDVLCARQSSSLNPAAGQFQGVTYSTIMPDVLRYEFLRKYPLYFARAKQSLRHLRSPTRKGILLIYGPPLVETIPLLWQARKQNYRVVFDIVEDDAVAQGMSCSPWVRMNTALANGITKYGRRLADGYIVISSRLHDKYQQMTKGRVPLLVRPISVDFSRFPARVSSFDGEIRLIYSGSYGPKDGVEVLLAAFEVLAGRWEQLRQSVASIVVTSAG